MADDEKTRKAADAAAEPEAGTTAGAPVPDGADTPSEAEPTEVSDGPPAEVTAPEEQTADEPAPEEPAAEEPAAEEPAAEEPAAEEPAAEEPTAEDPADEVTSAAEPATEPPAKSRARPAAPPKPPRSPEERAAERAERRHTLAASRRRWRVRQREKRSGRSVREPLERAESAAARPRIRQGVVVSNKANKTITVRIDVQRPHRMYKKIVRESSRLHAHDESNQANEGDTVRVVESRPLSRTKRWRLVEVVERAR